jgi:hypothetical protein
MQPRVQVELDIFSGMPNPVWNLSDESAQSFLRQLDALQRTRPTKLSAPLGYRGFVVQVTRASDTQQSIRIQNGSVQILAPKSTFYASDSGRNLERWLLETGKPHLEPEIFSLVQRAIR